MNGKRLIKMINITQEEIMKNWGVDNSDTPLVSVRCFTYNHELYIAQALDGFLMQKTDFPFEIIVHDDASTDKTADIIKEYELKFPKIVKPIYEVENQYSKHDGSLSRIMNSACKGKYVACCEGDDYWIDETKLQLQFDELEKHPDCSICFCKVQQIDKNNIPLKKTIPLQNEKVNKIITLKDFSYVQFYLGHWLFQTSSFFVRNDLLQIYILEKPATCFSLFPYGDMPIQLFMLLKGNGVYIDKIMSCYRVLSGGYNSKVLANPSLRKKDKEQLINAMLSFDEYTSHQYQSYINNWLIGQKIDIACINNDFKSAFRKEYKDYLLDKGICFCFKLFCRLKIPRIYLFIGNMKRKVVLLFNKLIS